MPEQQEFATKIAPKLKSFVVEEAKLIVGEGVPVFEILLTHIASPTKKVLRVTPNVETMTDGGSQDGVVRINIVATPAINVTVTDMQTKEEVSL